MNMDSTIYTVTKNELVAADTWEMTLCGDTSAFTAPGQFAAFALPGKYLRRPLSVCDWDGESFTVIYKVVGEGTAELAACARGDKLDILTGLGHGYTATGCKNPLVVGGGLGVPPMYALTKALIAAGATPTVILGFNTADAAFYTDRFAALADTRVYTQDGSAYERGLVTDGMAGVSFDTFFACGPVPMLQAVCEAAATDGQVSLEERMGCGFGACMGCSVKVAGGRRVCKDGPVFRKSELKWQ